MKTHIALLAAVALAVPTPSVAQANADDVSIRAFVASFGAAWNARDAATLAALFRTYADQSLGNRPPVAGRAAIQEQWTGNLGSRPEGITNTVVILNWVPEAS